MKFGYARVSKNDQSLSIQIQKLRDAGCHDIFQEKISGVKDDRKELHALMGKLRAGDTVYVVRLDRLGRRMLTSPALSIIGHSEQKNKRRV